VQKKVLVALANKNEDGEIETDFVWEREAKQLVHQQHTLMAQINEVLEELRYEQFDVMVRLGLLSLSSICLDAAT
jgi:excinuclease UvrABC helicase subunit UvrB